MTARRAGPKAAPNHTPPASLIDAVEQDVRASGAIPLKRAVQSPVLSVEGRKALLTQLVARGLEQSKRFVRVPLRVQLTAQLRAGKPLLVDEIATQIVGLEGPAERKSVIDALVRDGNAVRAVVGGREAIVSTSASTLDSAILQRVEPLTRSLANSITTALKGRGRSARVVLRDDVRAAIQQVFALVDSGTDSTHSLVDRVTDSTHSLVDRVLEAVRQHKPARGTLVFVPDVIRSLEPGVPMRDSLAALVEAARAGRVELRPESGLGTLKPDDALRCHHEPGGPPLSYARVLS